MSFDSSASKIDESIDDPFEDDYISLLELVAFVLFVIVLILIPSCCCSTPIEKEKRQ